MRCTVRTAAVTHRPAVLHRSCSARLACSVRATGGCRRHTKQRVLTRGCCGERMQHVAESSGWLRCALHPHDSCSHSRASGTASELLHGLHVHTVRPTHGCRRHTRQLVLTQRCCGERTQHVAESSGWLSCALHRHDSCSHSRASGIASESLYGLHVPRACGRRTPGPRQQPIRTPTMPG